MRRLPVPLLLALLVWAPPALAAAGGGSSGFGGGGGGGGAGFSGDGNTTGGDARVAVGMIVLFAIIMIVVTVLGVLAERRRRRRRDARAARVRLAAAEAAQDDAAFAADRVEREAAALFLAVQQAWTARDLDALERMCDPDLLVEWRRRLADFARKGWHNQVTVQGDPEIHYVGLVNREADHEDRAVVLVEATLVDVVVDRAGTRIKRTGARSETIQLREYWTLAKRGDRWTLRSIEQLGEGDHHLFSPLVASPWSDRRLRDEALVEAAVADAAGDAAAVAALVDLDFAADARVAALDLSLLDGRFAPAVLEACARAAVSAWVDAIDGADDPLLAVAAPDAVEALLYPRGDRRARRVVRGARVERMTLVALDGEADPPQMVVELALAGRRYLEDRDTVAVLDGSREREARWTERWTFALREDAATPWIVADAGDAPVAGSTA